MAKTPLLIRSLFCIVLTLEGIAITPAADYFVDNAPESGCADNPRGGSKKRPWCTINYGLSRIRQSDTLYINSGTYDETLYISASKSGTKRKPTQIRAYPNSKPILRGAGINTGRAKIINCSHLVIDGLGFTNMNQGIFIESSHHIQLLNCQVYDVGQEAIHIKDNSEYITIENCVVYNTGLWNSNGEGIYVGTGSAGPLDNTSNVTIRNNRVYNTSTDKFGGEAIEIKPGTHDCIIEGNLIFDSHTTGDAGAIEVNESHLGIQAWELNPNHIVRNNTIHNSGTAIRAGTGCLVYNNLIFGLDSGSYGILVDNNANDNHTRKIFHNTIHASPSSAYRHVSGKVDIQNNIGPTFGDHNIEARAEYFTNPSPQGTDYTLVEKSLAIDRGSDISDVVATDLKGDPRPVGKMPDLGAYEFQAETTAKSTGH